MPPVTAPLTLAHVVFSSRIAGGERHAIDLAHAQAALGHHVHVLGTAGSAVAGALHSSVQFHGLRGPLLRGWRVARKLRELGVDVAHGHLGPACKAVAWAAGPVRIATLHVGYKAHHHAQLDGLICVNRAQREHLPARAALGTTIYNWAPERGAAPARRLGLRAELGLHDSQLVVASVGRLHHSKGMDLLIAAFKAQAPADAVLALIGDGPERERLTALAAGDARIHLLGQRGDVDTALAEVDLFVSPSREEAFPLAMLEAMRAGCPVLSTATQGPLEMLDGQPARLVAIDDAPALGAALAHELARLRPLRAAERRVAYATALYDRSAAVGRVLSFYREVLAHRAQLARLQQDHEILVDPAWHA